MNILLFRRQIETLIGDLIGEYTMPNLVKTPAIRFREGEEQLDENIAVEGLEVIIEIPLPKASKALYSGTPVWPIYHVRLVQWSGYGFDEAVARIVETYDNNSLIPIKVPGELGPSKQCIISIYSSTPRMGQIKYQAP
jgi:hypothetical protein